MSPDRCCTALLVGAMILCAVTPVAAQDELLFADGPVSDTPIGFEFAPLVFQASILETRLSAGLVLDYIKESHTKLRSSRFRGTILDGETTYEGGVRISGIVEYRLVPSAYVFFQMGIREEEVSTRLAGIGDLEQASFMLGFKFTSSTPFMGTGRDWAEISVWPTASVALGAHMYDFSASSSNLGGQSLEFENSFAGEARIGIDVRIPPMLVVGATLGYYWTSPKFNYSNSGLGISTHDHFNFSTFLFGFHGELRF